MKGFYFSSELGCHKRISKKMTSIEDDNYCITYEEFNYLLSNNDWLLSKGIKDVWEPLRHLAYIDNIFHYNPHKIVKFYIDCEQKYLDKAQTINVLITPFNSNKETEMSSKTCHIQFIKNKMNKTIK